MKSEKVPMNPPFQALDDLLDLPFFRPKEREFVSGLKKKLAAKPEISPTLDANQELRHWVAQFGAWGIFDALMPSSLSAAPMLRVVLAREVLAYHSVLADLAFVMQFLGGIPLYFGSTPPIQAALAATKAGKSVAAFAITEPDAGTDLSRLSTSVRAGKDSFIINGEKHLISNVGAADYYVIFARHSDSEAAGKISAFLVPAKSKGLEEEAMPGMVPHPLGSLRLKDVEISSDHLIGDAGKGMKIALSTLSFCRPTVGAAACGMARRATEEAISHIRTRESFGGVLADLPLVKAHMSQSVVELDMARLMVYRAAWARDQAPEARHDRASSAAKWQATELAQGIVDRSLQLCGGVASLDGHKLSELYRALRPLRIYEGASEIHQMLVFDALLREIDALG